MRRVNAASGIAPFDVCRVADIGDAWVRRPFNLEDSLGEIAAFYREVHEAGVSPVSAGGDHSVTLAILRGIAAEAWSSVHDALPLVTADSDIAPEELARLLRSAFFRAPLRV